MKAGFFYGLPTVFLSAHSAFGQDAAASGGAQTPPSLLDALVQMLPMLAICYLIFYFMVIRPQETKTKKHKQMMEALKRGDPVVTSSGILGKVSSLEAEHVLVEIAQNVKIKVLSSHITKLEKAGA